MTRPTTYKQWRKLWQQELINLGVSVFYDWKREGRPIVDRDVYRIFRRLMRIRKRLDAEFEAMDATCYEALLEMLGLKIT